MINVRNDDPRLSRPDSGRGRIQRMVLQLCTSTRSPESYPPLPGSSSTS
jgi:hypothetical protein